MQIVTLLQFVRDNAIQAGRPFSLTAFSQHEVTDEALSPLQLRTLEASAMLPKESMLKKAAAPNIVPELNILLMLTPFTDGDPIDRGA